MIIEIEEAYEKELMSRGLYEQELKIFNTILNSISEEEMCLRASLGFFRFLYDGYKDNFSIFVKNYLLNMINNHFLFFNEISNIPSLFILSNNTGTSMDLSNPTRISIGEVPSDLKTYLCCENTDDSEMFLDIYQKINKSNKHIKMEIASYAGGNTNILQSYIERKKMIFFCIADSDKKYPNSATGNTAKTVGKLYSRFKPKLTCHYVLKVHEKENLLPYSVMNISSLDCEQSELIKAINKSNNDVKDYFDIKDGYSKEHRKKYRDDVDWHSAFDTLINKMRRLSIYHAEKGSKKLIHGINSNGAKKIINDTHNFDSFMLSLTNNQMDDWNQIFYQITRFGYHYKYKVS